MRFTQAERKHLNQLVEDCIIYEFSEREALFYIRKRFGQQITPRYYQMLKAKVDVDADVQKWLSHFVRIGFIADHRTRYLEMETMERMMFSILQEELQKPEQERDLRKILAIIEQLRLGNRRLEQMANGTVLLAEMKKLIDEALEA